MTTPDLSDFFSVVPIEGNSINGDIYLPLHFLSIVVLTILAVAAGTFYWRNKGATIRSAMQRSAVTAFMLIGLIYAIQGDFLWSSWVTIDVRTLKDSDTRSKLFRQDGTIYYFAEMIHKVISGHDYRLYTDYQDNDPLQYQAKKLQYYLLPSRNRNSADYVVVMQDKSVAYDAGSNLFTDGSQTPRRAELSFKMAENFYVLRLLP